MKKYLLTLGTLLISSNLLYSQTEIEPNDDCSQSFTINSYGDYSGSISSDSDIDYWLLTPVGEGNMTVTIDPNGGFISLSVDF